MRPAVLEQRPRGRRAGGPATAEAARGQLDQHAALDERADRGRVLLERRAALGMGERDPEAAARRAPARAPRSRRGSGAVRRLDQQVAAVAGERRERKLLVGQAGGRLEVDLGAGQHLDGQAACAQVLGQLARASGQLGRLARRDDRRAGAAWPRACGCRRAPRPRPPRRCLRGRPARRRCRAGRACAGRSRA